MKSKKGNKKKTDREKKIKLVRDSYTIPETEFALINELKQKCISQGVEIKKSEILRAGLLVLTGMDDKTLREVAIRVERIKTGRPKKN